MNEKQQLKSVLTDIKLSPADFQENIYKNYEDKIKTRIYVDNAAQTASDVNKIIILLNFCFYTRNNFFILNFNKSVIHKITAIYSALKTNTLTENGFFNDIQQFMGVDNSNHKLLRFILKRYKANFDIIEETHPLLTENVDLESIGRLLKYVEKAA